MHVQTHILSGWCVSNLAPQLTTRQRLFCMIAASIADIVGLGILLWPFNHGLAQNLYWDYHHRLGHCLMFGIISSALLAIFSKSRWTVCFFLYLTMFHLHLAMDIAGSGPGWGIHYLWPISDFSYEVAWTWPLFSWQNILTFFILLVWTVLIAIRHRRTPLELIVPSLERQLVGASPAAHVAAPGETTFQ
jgi:inner membrane protein